MQAQPGSSGWGTPVLCSRPTDPAGEHWNGKADSELVKGQRAAGQGQVTAPSATLCPHPLPPLQNLGQVFLPLAWLKATKEREMKHSASLSYHFFASPPARAPSGAELAANHGAVPSEGDAGHHRSAIPTGIWGEHANTQRRPLHTSVMAWEALNVTQDSRKFKLFWDQGKAFD